MSDLTVGDIVLGEVVAIKTFGAFIKLESGETGLVHISQVSSKYIDKVEDVLKVGDKVDVKILSVENSSKISLSIKDAEKNKNTHSANYKESKPLDNAANFEGMMKKWLKNSEERLSALAAKQKKNR